MTTRRDDRRGETSESGSVDRRVVQARRWVRLRDEGPLVPNLGTSSLVAEQLRSLAVQVDERIPDLSGSGYVLVVTGTDAKCGKTMTSLNLALTIARSADRRVLLVEADLWRPQLQRYLEVESTVAGLFQVLERQKALHEAVMTVAPEHEVNLDVLVAGGWGRMGDLLSGPRMAETVAAMGKHYDIIVIDSPPLSLASGRSLMRYADGALMVVGAGKTTGREIEEGLQIIGQKKTLGLVLNGVEEVHLGRSAYLSYAMRHYEQDAPEYVGGAADEELEPGWEAADNPFAGRRRRRWLARIGVLLLLAAAAWLLWLNYQDRLWFADPAPDGTGVESVRGLEGEATETTAPPPATETASAESTTETPTETDTAETE